jgi:hypothetical protein
MPAKKQTKKGPVKSSSVSTPQERSFTNDNLYISLDDAVDKRKVLLGCIKTSLLVQEEHEQIIELRKEKLKYMNAIKRDMDYLNSLYQQLKKLVPNLNSTILSTEKELGVVEEKFEEKVAKKREKESLQKSKLEEEIERAPSRPLSSEISVPSEKKSKLSRLDRIKNNLQVIESKLKNS